MDLSNDLISQFVKFTKDDNVSKQETTVYGTAVEYNGGIYVKLDGSEQLTPVNTTTDVKPGERVTVLIKNHTATATGNITSPAARTDDVKEIGSKITEFEVIVAHRVVAEDIEAVNAYIDNLKATVATFTSLSTKDLEAVNAEIDNIQSRIINTEYLKATDIEAIDAEIENLRATFGTFDSLTTDDLEAVNADIDHLKSYSAEFTYVSTNVLEAVKADIQDLDTKKLSAEQADIRYANIDFSNIGEAAVTKIFSESGIIEDLIVSEGKITGELVGVTIKGDLIEGNTIKADKLVVKGSDGIYYKLNFESGNFTDSEEVPDDGLHGSVIVANSITAEKIAVDDLVAFDATIGGFQISENSIYSGVKSSVDNTTRGIYLDNDGQMNFGDSNNYIKYYKDSDWKYKFEIAAQSIKLGGSGRNVEEAVDNAVNTANDAKETAAKGVKAIYRYYLLQSSTLDVPVKPTTYPPPSSETDPEWVDVEPIYTYAEESIDKSLYFVDCTIYNDNSWEYSEVSLSRSYEAVKDAQLDIDAANALITALCESGADKSLLTQTENGWQFDLTSLKQDVSNEITNSTNTIEESLNETNSNLNSLQTAYGELSAHVIIDKIVNEDDSITPIIKLNSDSDVFEVRITNQKIDFVEYVVDDEGTKKETIPANISNERLNIEKANVKEELQFGGFVWEIHGDGNMGLVWRGVE